MDYYQYQDLLCYLGIGGLMAYMLFVIYKLAEESRAGVFGTCVLFGALGLGMVGFVAKSVIQVALNV